MRDVPALMLDEYAALRFERLVAQIPAAVFMHPLEMNQPPFYISPRIEEITGYRPQELMTRADFLAPFVHPEDSEAMKPLGELTDITLEPFIATYRLRRKDGRWIWLYNETECVRGDDGVPLYWQGLVLDVTVQKETELALARSEARFRALVQRSTDATMIVEDGVGFVWISPAISNIIGWQPPVPDDHLKARLVHPDDLPVVDRMAAEVRTGPGAVSGCEARLAHADGGWRWVEVIGVNHEDNPAVGGIVYNVREITERKAAEQAMAHALELQQQANDELVALGKDRAEFLAMLAHDLRTPLTAILGISDLLRAAPDASPRDAQFAGTISANAGRMSRMVSQMLQTESLEARLFELDLEATSLNAFVAASVAGVQAAWPGRDIVLDLAPDLPDIALDRDQVTRAVTNLVGNALKYSPGGGAVTVATRRDHDMLEVAVTDRGIGIPPENLDRVFDRHVRVRSTATRDVEGFGLGLPIVRAIARAHGGDVTAKSAVGEGSTFVLRLPIKPRRRPGYDEAATAGEPVRCLRDDLWHAIAPMLPPRKARPRGGRPFADDRAVICGILFARWTDTAWSAIPQPSGAPSGVTCWRRLREWQEAGVWDEVEATLAGRLGGSGQAAWESACVAE